MKADYETNVAAFFSEFLATAILLIVILAVTDKRNTTPPYGLLPLVIFVVMLGIVVALGMNTGKFDHFRFQVLCWNGSSWAVIYEFNPTGRLCHQPRSRFGTTNFYGNGGLR